MAEFSGKIVSAFYANEAHDLVKIRWDDNGTLNVYHLPVDENNAEFQELLDEGWDLEKLLDETAEELRGQSQAYNKQVNQVAKELAREMLGMQVLQDQKAELEKQVNDKETTLLSLDKQVKIKKNEVDTEFFKMLFDDNANKEELFKFKLWALELDFVKEADKDIKSKIRKAERITEGMGLIDSLLK